MHPRHTRGGSSRVDYVAAERGGPGKKSLGLLAES